MGDPFMERGPSFLYTRQKNERGLERFVGTAPRNSGSNKQAE